MSSPPFSSSSEMRPGVGRYESSACASMSRCSTMERTRTLLRGFGKSSSPKLDHVLASSLPAPGSVGSTLSSSLGMVWLKREGDASPPPTDSIILLRMNSERLMASIGSIVATSPLCRPSDSSRCMKVCSRWKRPVAPCRSATSTPSRRSQAAFVTLSSMRPERILWLSSSEISLLSSVDPIPLALSSLNRCSASSFRLFASANLPSTSFRSSMSALRLPSCPTNLSTISSNEFTPVACRTCVNCSSSLLSWRVFSSFSFCSFSTSASRAWSRVCSWRSSSIDRSPRISLANSARISSRSTLHASILAALFASFCLIEITRLRSRRSTATERWIS
mmetsp:Transcript_16919/g.35340  ORF Transcript_16919/g.35340 Transcript_16919/m.35340 type:complete len:335 (-) Transcript_16919:551-1555(-)